MSAELKQFLYAHGIATSRTTGYNPQGNGQVERYNGVIWKAVTLTLKSRGLGPAQWEIALPNALNSIRSLLCTSINATPHERMFTHQRRHTSDQSGPNWLTYPGTVFMKRPVRQSKYEPMVEKVELIDANPEYAHVRLPDGRETTVSVRHLAPVGTPPTDISPPGISSPGISSPGTAPPGNGVGETDVDDATAFYPRAIVETSPARVAAPQGIRKPPSDDTAIYSRRGRRIKPPQRLDL